MTFIPPGENIIETKNCAISGEKFFITDKDMEFYDKISPVFGGKKYSIPSPTLCPDERLRRRLCWRNERKLYHRKCDLSGKQIISVYHPDSDVTVYDQKTWWSDEWSPSDSGINFDDGKSFFSQFSEVLHNTPLICLHSVDNEGSEYVNYSGYNKSSYLLFASEYCENCMYANRSISAQNCIDVCEINNSQNCYECTDTENSNSLQYANDCSNCQNCMFIQDCIGCSDCLFCANLRNKQYCILNEQLTKDNYIAKKNEILQSLKEGNRSALEVAYKKFLLSQIHKASSLIDSELCIGNKLAHTKNCISCFEGAYMQDCKYCVCAHKVTNLIDVCHTTEGEWGYEGMSFGYNSSNGLFVNGMWSSSQSLYGINIHNSSNTFGCVSLKKSSHCILNKSYSKQEYEALCGKLIDHMRSTGEWGEFFGHEVSPFGYNESIAQEYFPSTKEEIVSKGWNWKKEDESSSYHGPYYSPKNIAEYSESEVGKKNAKENIEACTTGIMSCSKTSKPFKITPHELAFYIENKIPLPTKCPDQRHKERMQLRNPRKLFQRTCDKCGEDIHTTYAPERPETVYCEECYRKEIY